jgi:RimJ/RimL family protein N-acetyltransferase
MVSAIRPEPTTLLGSFIRLEPLRESDLPELFCALGDPRVFAGGYGGGPAGYRSTVEEFVEFGKTYYSFGRNLVFGVRLPSGELVGTSTLGDFDEVREHAHIGWTAYHPSVWGGPVNPEAKLLMLGLAFDHGYGRVKLQADSLNDRSRAAILKLGAQFEGIVRRDQLRPDGIWRSTAVYSILRDEWPDVRAGLEARLAAFDGAVVKFDAATDPAPE